MKIINCQFNKQKILCKSEIPSENLSIPAFGNVLNQAVNSFENKLGRAFQKFIEIFDWKPRKIIKESKIEVEKIEAEAAIIKAENKVMKAIINHINNTLDDAVSILNKK